MAVITPIHNPDQDVRCLHGLFVRAGDWALKDADRFRAFGSWTRFLAWLRGVPHMQDIGAPLCGDWCCPMQRENHWAEDGMNCWERAQHAIAAAAWLLPPGQSLTVWDRNVKYHDKQGQPRTGRHISILEFDTNHNSQKPLYPADIPGGVLAEPALYLNAREAANFDEAEARKYGAVALDIVGGVGGAIAGAFGGPAAGSAVTLGVKGITDIFRPGGPAPSLPTTNTPTVAVEHGISTTTMIGIGLALVGGVAAISLLRK